MSSPFVPDKKCAAAAAATAAGAVLASLINASSQDSANVRNLMMNADTNKTNLKIANQVNEMSQAQFNSNMQWLREQYFTNRKFALEDRDYNDPRNIVSRLIAAGVNPSSYFGSGATGIQGSSSVGAPSQSSFQTGYSQAGHVDPIQIGDGLSESIMHAFDAYHQNKLIDAQCDKTKNESQIARANAFTQLAENVARVRNIYADTEEKLANKNLSVEQRKNLEKQRDMLNHQIDLFMKTMDDQIESLQLSNARMKRETSHIDFEENLAAQRFNIEAALAKSNIQLNGTQMSLLLQNVGLVAAQTQTEYERGRNISADTIAKQIEISLRNLIKNEKVFEANKVESSKLLKEIRGFSHYLGDLIIGPIVQGLKF